MELKRDKLFVIKEGIIDIMNNLISEKLLNNSEESILQFCIDQHNYKLEHKQINGFDKPALIDTIDTLTEILGHTVIDEKHLEILESEHGN
jgi:transcriptional regulator CtsR